MELIISKVMVAMEPEPTTFCGGHSWSIRGPT